MFNDTFERLRIETTGAEINLVHGGSGPPLLLLHGYPQTHFMWHAVAPELAEQFHVVCPDLRGYGDSSKPPSTADHTPYSKRAMASDLAQIMAALGYGRFLLAGHDRGARVAHRLALDYPDKVGKICVMDIVPTYHMFKTTDQAFATGYYHWFFLIQPYDLPEHLIGCDPDYFLAKKLGQWSAPGAGFAEQALAEYLRCFRYPATIHASCEDYRAAASIDLEHDEADLNRKIQCPLLALWGNKGFVHRTYDVLNVWRAWAQQVEGRPLDCGHFLPEEAPASVCSEMLKFFGKHQA